MAEILEGITYTSSFKVDKTHTASFLGSGDMDVLATPAMVAIMENAAMLALVPYLEEGNTTVGGHIEASHTRATPLGATVCARATVSKVDGKKIFFRIDALDEHGAIGSAIHLRFIVNREKFLANVK